MTKGEAFHGWERSGEVWRGFRGRQTSRSFFDRYKKVVSFGFLTLWWVMIEVTLGIFHTIICLVAEIHCLVYPNCGVRVKND